MEEDFARLRESLDALKSALKSAVWDDRHDLFHLVATLWVAVLVIWLAS